MKPEYIDQLADIADPDQLWRLPGLQQLDLPPEKRQQLDTGIALRRYAQRQRELARLLQDKRSLLITPLAPNCTATKSVDTPPEHQRLRRCETCKGYGFIPYQAGQTPETFEQGTYDCPDC